MKNLILWIFTGAFLILCFTWKPNQTLKDDFDNVPIFTALADEFKEFGNYFVDNFDTIKSDFKANMQIIRDYDNASDGWSFDGLYVNGEQNTDKWWVQLLKKSDENNGVISALYKIFVPLQAFTQLVASLFKVIYKLVLLLFDCIDILITYGGLIWES